MNEPKFSPLHQCEHCGNRAPMQIVAEHSDVKTYYEGRTGGFSWDAGNYYELLKCPACGGIILTQHYYHDGLDPDDWTCDTLYPSELRVPLGLPAEIGKAYEAAIKVRPIDANAYAVLAGRVLEMVCEDRKAEGFTLGEKLKHLAKKGEIPDKLVGVADGLRLFRNVGAHAGIGELTPAEVPILDDLSKAILEYLYSAPYLAQQAAERYDALRTSSKKAIKKSSTKKTPKKRKK